MIEIILSDKAFENDVYPLVKAFYPEEVIKTCSEKEYELLQEEHKFNPDQLQAPVFLKLIIFFREKEVGFTLETDHFGTKQETLPLSDKLARAAYKNAMKRCLYQHLSELTGRTLPWGILTGIRPTKLVYEQLEAGNCEEDVYQRMREEYLCSDDKIGMSIEIAHREAQLLKDMDYRNGYSLYIGIPFCPSTCLYCSFTSYSIEKYKNYAEQYLLALEKEIRFAAGCLSGKKLTCVYFGGGTPTTLTAEQLDWLLALVKEQFDFRSVMEFCVEAGRPDSITREKLEVLKKWGVNRISINPQSMQQKTLDLIGRKHTIEQIIEAFHLAREVGHENINMDIILGLPGETPAEVLDTLTQIRSLNPESLTVHTLAIKRAARLNIEKESYSDKKANEVPKMLEAAIAFAKENSYHPYYLYRQKNMADNLENIGYARYGKEGLYNILIMEEKQTILALGAGGMSKFVFHQENRIERVDNVKSVTDYIERIDEMINRKKEFIINNQSYL